MQPPPQAAPSGVIGPPPAGTPQSMFWSNRPYRRQANNNTPVTPITCPLQPVTDPFAFSRQALQSTSLGSSSKSSLPILQGPAPAAFPQRPGLPVPHTNAGDTPQGPVSQPRADGGLFSSVLTPSAPLESELNRSADGAPSSEPEVQTLSCPQYIPGVGPDGSHGGHPPINLPGPDRPLSTQNLHDGAPALAPPPFIPQPHQPTPGQWGPGQSSPQPSGQHYWPRPEGSVQNAVPHASSVPHFPAPSNPHHGPGHEQLNPLMPLPGPLASDGSTEAAYLQSGNHSTSNFDPENAFRQNSQAGNTRVGRQKMRRTSHLKKQALLVSVTSMASPPVLHSVMLLPIWEQVAFTRPFPKVPAVRPRSQEGIHNLIFLSLQVPSLIDPPQQMLPSPCGAAQPMQVRTLPVAHNLRTWKTLNSFRIRKSCQVSP